MTTRKFLFSKNTRKILLAASLVLSIIINAVLLTDSYNFLLILLWILSLCFFLISSSEKWTLKIPKIHFSVTFFLSLIVILVPLVVRLVSYNGERIHGDEFIFGYFSSKIDLLKDNFFSYLPKDRAEWTAQSPMTFFYLQKIFFAIFGESIAAVKLSGLPYVLLTSLGLYLVAKTLFDKKTAIISLILYAFFAVSVYHDTFSVNYAGSIASFIFFFYFFLKALRERTNVYASLAGIFCGFSYLFMNHSYIAFPLMVLFYAIYFVWQKKAFALKQVVLSVMAFILVISPFLSRALAAKNFYFFQRFNQVNLFYGSWSSTQDKVNLKNSLESFYTDGIGGGQGYFFGHQAFFEKISLLLFLLGLFLSFFLLRRKKELLFVYVIFLASFAGMALTVPPPSYHRLSVAFPFFALMMSIPLSTISSWKIIPKSIAAIVVTGILVIYSVNNYGYFLRSTLGDTDSSVRLGNFLIKSFPDFLDRKIYIAAFPSYHLKKVFHFFNKSNMKNAEVDYHEDVLEAFNVNEKYLYIILFPQVYGDSFIKKDNKGRLSYFSNDLGLFAN